MAINVKDEIHLGSIELIRNYAFYGHILVQMPKIFVSGKSSVVPTLGVGKDNREEVQVKLFINTGYVEECYTTYSNNNEKEAFTHLIEVLKHEILHIVFGHLSIIMPDKTRLAVASDLAVNSYCNRDKMLSQIDPETKQKVSQGLFPKDYNLDEKKSALWYYTKLLDNEKFKKQCKEGAFGLGGLFSDAVSSHEAWEEAQKDPMLGEMMKDLVRKSAKICRETNTWGDVAGDLIEQIDDLSARNKPKLPWQHILRLFIASAMESVLDYTMKRRSKRYHTRPGTKMDDVLNLAIGIDTSGSISNDQLCLFFNELYWISKNGVKITVLEADTQIHREYPYEQFDGKAEGRGGTDLEPVLKEVSERKFDALIYFTDFYAPKIEKNYRIPVLWVLSDCELSESEYPYKWGSHIHIKDGEIQGS